MDNNKIRLNANVFTVILDAAPLVHLMKFAKTSKKMRKAIILRAETIWPETRGWWTPVGETFGRRTWLKASLKTV